MMRISRAFLIILFGLLAACASTAPLPATLNIVPPSPDIPREIAAFSGVWEGIWDISSRDIILVVEKIDTEKASVIISVGNAYGEYPAHYAFKKAVVRSGPSIGWTELNGNKIVFTINKELNEVKGVETISGTGSKTRAILHKRNTPINPENIDSSLCSYYSSKSEYYKAIDECTKDINFDNSNAESYHSRCYAYLNTGQLDEAIADCNKSIELIPINIKHKYRTNTYLNLANAYMNKEQYDQAIATLDKIIEMNPRIAVAYNNRAFINLIKDRFAEAKLDIQKALELDPDNIYAIASMAELYYLTNKNELACKWLQKAIEKGWSDWNYIETHKNYNDIRNIECYQTIVDKYR